MQTILQICCYACCIEKEHNRDFLTEREKEREGEEKGKRGLTRAAKMKGQASVIKNPWVAIDFSLASITPTSRRWTWFIYRVYEYRRGGYANLLCIVY